RSWGRNAASARRARSCPPWHCCEPIRNRPWTRRAWPCPAICAGAAPMTITSGRSCMLPRRREMANNLVGKDFAPADVVAKVTGEAKYGEDFRAEGMLFAKIWSSPVPHARVRNLDTSEALALPGVVAILTPDDVPSFP